MTKVFKDREALGLAFGETMEFFFKLVIVMVVGGSIFAICYMLIYYNAMFVIPILAILLTTAFVFVTRYISYRDFNRRHGGKG